jgi:spermidine synthase
MLQNRMHRGARLMAPLLFGSGACALVYQTVWMREFRLFFGASTAANAAVLAVFIGGLGLGGLLLGARADRHPRPLRFYADLELLISLWAATTPGLLWLARRAYIALGGTTSLGLAGGTVVRLLLTTLVLAGPTLLMGGTLPAVARGVETSDDRGRRSTAWLYGVNTLGAVAGCTLGTFVLLEVFGARLALWLCCLVNVAIALAARAIARALPMPSDGSPTSSAGSAPTAPEGAPEEAPLPAWLTLSAAAAAGFAFFLMELVWYRMLGPLLGGNIFSFGLILAVALLGIGLGAAFHSFLSQRRAATVTGLALSCLLEAAFIALPYALGDRLALLALYLRPFGALGFGGFVAGWTLVTAIVVLPAAFVSGVQFPLLIGLLGRGRAGVGKQVGLAYAANTAGSIAGALAGGFGLIPLLSAPGCWRAVALLLALLGVVAAGVAARRGARLVTLAAPAALVVAIAAMLLATGPTAVWRHSPIGVGRVPAAVTSSATRLHAWMRSEQASILWQADGVEGSVAMSQGTGLAFILNGKIDGHSRIDASTMVWTGLVGAVLHPAPKKALVIGLGTGSTVGWLAAIPSLERVDVAELEPKILDVAEQCGPVNRNVMHNPKVHMTLGDAREILLTSRERYEIIFSEPSNPYRAGISNLFTADYYRSVRERLTPGGLFLQWVQAYDIGATTVATIYATLGSVYPAIETWELGTNDLLLVASERPLTHDLTRLRARLAEEPFRSALARAWRTTRPEGFLAHFAAGPAFARALLSRPGQLIGTDDLNPIEFGFARTASNLSSFSSSQLRALARARHADQPALTGGEVSWNDVLDEWSAFQASEGMNPEARPELTPEQRARAHAEGALLAGDFGAVVHDWQSQSREPRGPTELATVAFALAARGDERLGPYLAALAPLEPIEADMIRARFLSERQRYEEATTALEQAFAAYRRDPWPWVVVTQSALVTAVEVAQRAPELGPRLHAALIPRFAVSLFDEARLEALTTIATRLKKVELCRPTLAQLEPHVPWRRNVLLWRAYCYEKLGDPRAELAESELSAFESEQAPTLAERL